MKRNRESWLDLVKLFACVLVVLGHLFPGLITAGLVSDSFFFIWFKKTVYYFHVPLFFICSGYLYQKYSVVTTLEAWWVNTRKKLIALGIPYVVFSLLTWTVKKIFDNAVNEQADSIIKSLFVSPISPYWYLFALLIIFMIVPTFKSKGIAFSALVASFALKVVFTFEICPVESVNNVLRNIIWFALGMCLCYFDLTDFFRKKAVFVFGLVLSCAYVPATLYVAKSDVIMPHLDFVMGIIGCVATLSVLMRLSGINIFGKLADVSSAYTMPIFLLHTLFAATMRSVLVKIGITNGAVHLVIGLIISFAGPVFTYWIASKVKFLDFWFYPGKYIKISTPRGDKNG